MLNLDYLLDNDELTPAQQIVVRRYFNYELKKQPKNIKVNLVSKKTNYTFRVHWVDLVKRPRHSLNNVYKRAMFHIIEETLPLAYPDTIKKIHRLLSKNYTGPVSNHFILELNSKQLSFPHPSDLKSQTLWQALQLLEPYA